MRLEDFNKLRSEEAKIFLAQCCTCERWIEQIIISRPFSNRASLLERADDVWGGLNTRDYLEAFRGHPKIGDIKLLKGKYPRTQELSADEQSSLATASEAIMTDLAEKNKEYEKKFGFIFIVCANKKSTSEMLAILLSRLPNNKEVELANAIEEQRKIYHLRIKKLL